jgi:hypothetical protein
VNDHRPDRSIRPVFVSLTALILSSIRSEIIERPLMKARLVLMCLAPLAVIAFSGCGGEQSVHVPLGKVTGTVTYNDKPLAQGTITILPANGRPASGQIKDGKIIDVTTYDKTGDGAPLGTHPVAIRAVENTTDMYAKPKSLVPAKYGDTKTSGLSAEIKSGENTLEFKLKD